MHNTVSVFGNATGAYPNQSVTQYILLYIYTMISCRVPVEVTLGILDMRSYRQSLPWRALGMYTMQTYDKTK